MARKTAPKTARSPVTGAEIPLGAHPGNTGGKKGRSGAKPFWWRDFCRSTLADPRVQKRIQMAARNANTVGWASLIRTLAEYAEGVPEPMTMTPAERRRRIAELLGLGD